MENELIILDIGQMQKDPVFNMKSKETEWSLITKVKFHFSRKRNLAFSILTRGQFIVTFEPMESAHPIVNKIPIENI